jgi:hypothetical protein
VHLHVPNLFVVHLQARDDFFWLIMKRDTKTDKHRLHTVCSTHVDVQLPLLRFDFNKLHLIGYLDVACSGGFLSLLGNGFLLG